MRNSDNYLALYGVLINGCAIFLSMKMPFKLRNIHSESQSYSSNSNICQVIEAVYDRN